MTFGQSLRTATFVPGLPQMFEIFHEGWEYQERLGGGRRHFHDWRSHR